MCIGIGVDEFYVLNVLGDYVVYGIVVVIIDFDYFDLGVLVKFFDYFDGYINFLIIVIVLWYLMDD